MDGRRRRTRTTRNILVAYTDVRGADPLAVVNVHADAYGRDGTKLRHITRFEAELDTLDAAGVRFVAGGDLNTLPPGTSKLSGFPDTVCTDESYVADDYSAATDALAGLYETYEPYISRERYRADEARYFTHTVQGPADGGFWNRTLDYLFTNGEFVPDSGDVHQDTSSGGIETMRLSDHALRHGFAIEPRIALGWVFRRRVTLELGERMSYARYPVGTRLHATPYADVRVRF